MHVNRASQAWLTQARKNNVATHPNQSVVDSNIQADRTTRSCVFSSKVVAAKKCAASFSDCTNNAYDLALTQRHTETYRYTRTRAHIHAQSRADARTQRRIRTSTRTL